MSHDHALHFFKRGRSMAYPCSSAAESPPQHEWNLMARHTLMSLNPRFPITLKIGNRPSNGIINGLTTLICSVGFRIGVCGRDGGFVDSNETSIIATRLYEAVMRSFMIRIYSAEVEVVPWGSPSCSFNSLFNSAPRARNEMTFPPLSTRSAVGMPSTP